MGRSLDCSFHGDGYMGTGLANLNNCSGLRGRGACPQVSGWPWLGRWAVPVRKAPGVKAPEYKKYKNMVNPVLGVRASSCYRCSGWAEGSLHEPVSVSGIRNCPPQPDQLGLLGPLDRRRAQGQSVCSPPLQHPPRGSGRDTLRSTSGLLGRGSRCGSTRPPLCIWTSVMFGGAEPSRGAEL